MPDDPPATAHDAADLERRFGGLVRLYGSAGATRIRAAHVAVVGIGGVGSWAVEALARSGVGRLTLIDLDHVAESNVNRQIHALTDTLGQAKVLAMRDRIARINPDCRVAAVEEFVDADNWPALLAEPADAVIDACDDLRAKVTIASCALASSFSKRAQDARPPLFISVGAAGGKRLAHQFEIDDLARATHDPLLAKLRERLRKDHGAPREGRAIGISCVFSREPVRPPDPSCALDDNGARTDGSLNCHGWGSVVAVTATFGQCAAGWVLDKLASGAS